MMFIHTLQLCHFRNYATAELETDGGSVILTGPNGAGKTNILEAVSLLSPGRGLRKAKLRDLMAQSSAEPWVIAAQCAGLQGSVQIGTSLDPDGITEKRLVKIDGEKVRGQTTLAEHLSIAWQTPQMDGLFLGSDGDRRRYLDRLIYGFDAEHVSRVNRYDHAMRERNRLLQTGRHDPAWLNALEETMAQSGVAIAMARLETLDRLNASMKEGNGAFPRAQMCMQGGVETTLDEMPAADAEQWCQDRLASQRLADQSAGRATFGVHRSVWQVTHQAKQMEAAYCSTGEQKALLLSILLAHARARKQWLGSAPILLLDEVVAHLDQQRREALAEAIQLLGSQVWLTGTDAADFRAFETLATHRFIEHGAILKTPSDYVDKARIC